MRPHRNRLPGVKLRSCLGTIAGFLLLCSALFGQEFKPRLTLLGHKARIMCVAVNPDGKLLASGGDDGIIRFWDVASGKEQNTIEVASGSGSARWRLAWTAKHSLRAAAGEDRTRSRFGMLGLTRGSSSWKKGSACIPWPYSARMARSSRRLLRF